MFPNRFRFTFIFSIVLVITAVTAWAKEIKFNRDVRPILSENCFRCHGPDKGNRKAKLRLDVREVALERVVFVPGKPDESELVKRIYTNDPDDHMPPPDSHKQLTEEQKQTLRDWIAQGAEYEAHWAYILPERPAIPAVKDKSWVQNPIDALVLHLLEQKNVQPSPEADKRTLLRRLTLDLTGLPPSLEELNAFVKNKSAKAYEREVDRLLASPRFGERMAVPWLDAVRFADTVGYHGDQPQNVFPYRDYVIDAFNKNKPFDQFTIEQLAGDLLPNPTDEQRTATCFNRLNMMTREGGAQAKEYLAKYQADRVRTVSGAWLGSTMGCCECHDHKYDPFSTKDFYSMEAFFADLKQWGVYSDYGYNSEPELKGAGNDSPFPPEIQVDSPYLQQRMQKIKAQIGDLFAQSSAKLKIESAVASGVSPDVKGERLAARKHGRSSPATTPTPKSAFSNWCETSSQFLIANPDGWLSPSPNVSLKIKDAKPGETNFSVAADQTVSFTGKPAENVSLSLKVPPMWLAAIRLEVSPQEEAEQKEVKGKRKRKAPMLTLSASLHNATATNALSFYHADADHKRDRFSLGQSIIGITGGWLISPDDEMQTGVWLVDKPLEIKEGDTLVVNFGGSEISSARVSVTPFVSEDLFKSGADESLRQALAKNESKRSLAERGLLNEKYFLGTAWDAEAWGKYKQLHADLLNCRNGKARTMVAVARPEPYVTKVLARGNWQDENGEVVQPNVPRFLPQPANAEGRRLTRLDLAQWLVSKENPLTSRAVMNRMWKQFFGNGISVVVDDLGGQGEPPVNPELLDWLAVEFRESGWDVKHMVKLMVMSETYRQISNQRQDLRDVDPNNRFMASQSPRRLDAEFVRDNALFIAGLLNLDYGGPSAHPYQPPGYYVNLQFPDRDYIPEKDERQYRRGVYAWWQRTFLQPMMANFDAPAREESNCTRNLSNTPLQALSLLNDPSFVEAARVFAQDALSRKMKDDAARLDFIFQKALCRSPKIKEQTSLQQFLSEQREHYKEHNDEAEKLAKVGIAPAAKNISPVELAAWANVCRVVLNLQEAITKY